MHLVFLPTTLLIVVEDVLPDVLPAIMVSGDVVDTLLQALIASPAAVEEDSQQQHCKKHSGGTASQLAFREKINGTKV